MSDAQGSRVGSTFGPYRLKRLLGRGGMGEVYEAEHTVKEWTVAVKLMSETFSKDPVFRERMKREARITGRLQEPHVVPIHDYGEIDGQMYLEMRLIEGTDLDHILKRFGPLTPPRAVAIITQIASALDAAHAAGVMHRDVKPQNILVTRDDFAYLVDFGIASATTDEKLTQLGTAVGTWKYMAPERFSNDEVTYRADIYALACVLHECLTGSPPYRADSASMLVTAHLMDPIPQPSTLRSGIPKAFDAVIARGMAKSPRTATPVRETWRWRPTRRSATPIKTTLPTSCAAARKPPCPARPQPSRRRPCRPPGWRPRHLRPRSAGTATRPATPATVLPRRGRFGALVRTFGGSRTAGTRRGLGAARAGTNPATSRARGPLVGPDERPDAGQPADPHPGVLPGRRLGRDSAGHTAAAATPGPPAWNQGQQPSASRNRNPGPIVAAVAIVLVLVVGGVGIWLVTRPKPAPPPKPISEDRLSALLLSPSEINSVMGASNIQPGKPITSMDTSPVTLSLPDCQAALYTSQDPVYAGTGYTGISGLVSSEPGDTYDHWVNQAVVAFPSADKARSFLQSAAGKWKNCAGKTVTVTNQGKTYRWTFADVVGSPPKMTVIDTQEGADGWECQRAMSVANNVIVDINACGYQITDQGGQIADQIIAKVNKETK
ncbi:hypothetical protein NIIDMKKI_17340 [Mycobacterium kansasii]|uniref:non-specific serine/threonine protein kinase n=1 Tax=Mycobacterium kansasii TaxID=1768 RepID=A0A7G1IDK4_MYCKA|nr:hypothetical protein NIIDMKKI_17340 [Mycobacterium kansasii]